MLSALLFALAADGSAELKTAGDLELDGLSGAWRFITVEGIDGDAAAWGDGAGAGSVDRRDDVRALALPTSEELRGLSEEAATGAARADLFQAWTAVSRTLDALRSLPDGATIRGIEDGLEEAEVALDAFLESASRLSGERRVEKARLLARGGEIERPIDRLEYVASRIRLYAKGQALSELSIHLLRTVRAVASGDGVRYVEGLLLLLDTAAAWGGRELRRDAADSIRSTCDALIRRVLDRSLSRSLTVTLDAAFGDVNLAIQLDAERKDSAAPSGDSSSAGGRVGAEYGSGEDRLALTWRLECAGYDDDLKEGSRKTTSSIEAEIACRLGAADVGASLVGERERYPFRIGSEIVWEAVRDTLTAVAALIETVHAAGLPSAAESALLGDLGEATRALEQDRRGDAVGALEDFIDDLETERWKGNIPDAIAAELADRALRILPRRTIRRLEVPLSFEVATADGTIGVEFEWVRTIYPASSALSRTVSSVATTWEGSRGDWDLAVGHERKATIYPASADKNTVAASWTFDAESPAGSGGFGFGLEWDETLHAAKPEKNQRSLVWSAACEGDWQGTSWLLATSRAATMYPNDPAREGTRDDSEEGKATVRLGNGDLKLCAERRQRTTTCGVPVQETAEWSLTWDGEPAKGVGIALSIDWETHTDWEKVVNDRRRLHFAVEVTLDL